jgi:hypothetical protein
LIVLFCIRLANWRAGLILVKMCSMKHGVAGVLRCGWEITFPPSCWRKVGKRPGIGVWWIQALGKDGDTMTSFSGRRLFGEAGPARV